MPKQKNCRPASRVNRLERITPVLNFLPWILICFSIDRKVLLSSYKEPNGLTTLYISELLSLYDPAPTLRSSGRGLPIVPDSQLMTKEDRAFELRTPRLWNTLPEEIRQAKSVVSFKSKLKPYFHGTAFPTFIIVGLVLPFFNFYVAHLLLLFFYCFVIRGSELLCLNQLCDILEFHELISLNCLKNLYLCQLLNSWLELSI